MIFLTDSVFIPESEIELSAIRSQGAGGQNVNKVASAIHLRFDVKSSSLPEAIKDRLLAMSDQRISREGAIIIKAQKFRTQEKNRADALARLEELVRRAMVVRKVRRATKPGRTAQKRRLDNKSRRGETKALRARVRD